MESTIIRNNLMEREGYSPYCGDELCKPRKSYRYDRWPRTIFNGKQFKCPNCGWISTIDPEFIERYKNKWNLKR
jgi:hypothetical protein